MDLRHRKAATFHYLFLILSRAGMEIHHPLDFFEIIF